jgi:hypothetical protein
MSGRKDESERVTDEERWLRNRLEITSRNRVLPIIGFCGPEVRDFWSLPWMALGFKSSE